MSYLSHEKSLLFRFSHDARFQKAVQLADIRAAQTILDYGCADGRLLSMLPDGVNKIGYDPSPQPSKFKIVKSTSELPDSLCDVITLCEVLEHVSEVEKDRILKDCKRLLKPNGRLIVSVPVEVGLSSLIKSVARYIKVRPLERNMTVGNVLRSVFYLPVTREVDDTGPLGDVYGHMGFDYRKLRLTGFTVRQREFSPLPLGPLINSQVFYLAQSE